VSDPVRTWQTTDRPRQSSGTDDAVWATRQTMRHYARWRDENPAAIARHVGRYIEHLGAIAGGSGAGWVPLGRRRRQDRRLRAAREIAYFLAYDMGEIPVAATVVRIEEELGGGLAGKARRPVRAEAAPGAARLVESVVGEFPALEALPHPAWLGERFERLHRILPESVVRSGGMGKAVRAAVGVLAIAACDTLDVPPATRSEHLDSVVPGAYALGAAYVVIDDTLHDGEHLSPSDRAWCHELILRALRTGALPSPADIPDHPLAEELFDLYALMLERRPFDRYEQLYRAAETMYTAQSRDAALTVGEDPEVALTALYPDIAVKSGMSRVVANILARRATDVLCQERCLATTFLGQLKDDLRDRDEDRRCGRVTPFTYPADRADTNPLHDLFAYEAYAVQEVFGGDEVTADAFTYIGAVKLASCLCGGRGHADDLLRRYGATSEIERFLRAASGASRRAVARSTPTDMRIKEGVGRLLGQRRQTQVDARTFVFDRLPSINEATARYCPPDDEAGLGHIVAYAMHAPAKRLRPALGLMLAEALGVDTSGLGPFIAASELFHTASLLFDDLPAQDDAEYRRGRPTAHTVFDEGRVQLAAISMISTGFGLLAQLDERYPAEKVTAVIAYLGTMLGPNRLCRGQDLDLCLGRSDEPVTGEQILDMYELKTSTTLEAALVPLMMLEDRPRQEVELVKRYARNAGIVFQIRDDILDLTASTEDLGKDAGNDLGKVNVVRVYGLPEARRLMGEHLDDAIACCAELPFDTQLLEGMVTHFAKRKR
jgi:geranylgeranyl pyrophosphate synthase